MSDPLPISSREAKYSNEMLELRYFFNYKRVAMRVSMNGSGTFALQNDHFRTASGNGYMRRRRRARLTGLIGRPHTRPNRVCGRPIRRTAARRQAVACTPLGRPAWRCSTRRTAASMPVPDAGAASGLAVLSLHIRAQPRPPTHWSRLCAPIWTFVWSCCSPVLAVVDWQVDHPPAHCMNMLK